MSRRNLNAIIRYLRQLTGSANANGASDAELLERYVRDRDEAAFELLLWRHGTLVFNVCRRVLPREQDAEDAFQATFLAFVRKASSISRRGSVAAWLYKVAFRVALEARERARKTVAVEKPGGEMLAVHPVFDSQWSDVRPILDEELNRLPERLRRPIILCYLEGKSNEEAAQELGCRLGTIYSRLSRGRELLRLRLQRRGVTLSVTALTAVLTASAVESAPAIPLMRTAVHAALAFGHSSSAAAVSPRVATLAEGVLRTMFVTKLKIAAVMLLIIGVAAGGVWSQARTAGPQTEARADDPSPKPKAGDKKDAKPIGVKVVKPKRGLVFLMNASAKVIAAQQQQVVPLVSGTVKEVLVDIGDQVKKGQTLLVLDAPLVTQELEQARVALDMAQAQMEEARSQVATAMAEVESFSALLQVKQAEKKVAEAALNARKRVKERLHNQRVVQPLADLEDAASKVQVAEAQVVASEATVAAGQADVKIKHGKLEHARAALKTASAAVRSARSVVDKARVQEGFTQLRAAFDGVVTRRTIDPGNFVQPSDSRLLRPLLTVQSIDRVRIAALVGAEQARSIQRGLPVELDIDGAGRIPGQKIARFSPTLDNENHTMMVEIDFDNTGKHRLLPGMSGRVTNQGEALTIPSTCMVLSDEQSFVFIVRDGKAHRTKVDVIIGVPETDVIKGIQASDLVITDPASLKDGTPVKIQNSP
jgi:RND family efflux transporter MFP subunit